MLVVGSAGDTQVPGRRTLQIHVHVETVRSGIAQLNSGNECVRTGNNQTIQIEITGTCGVAYQECQVQTVAVIAGQRNIETLMFVCHLHFHRVHNHKRSRIFRIIHNSHIQLGDAGVTRSFNIRACSSPEANLNALQRLYIDLRSNRAGSAVSQYTAKGHYCGRIHRIRRQRSRGERRLRHMPIRRARPALGQTLGKTLHIRNLHTGTSTESTHCPVGPTGFVVITVRTNIRKIGCRVFQTGGFYLEVGRITVECGRVGAPIHNGHLGQNYFEGVCHQVTIPGQFHTCCAGNNHLDTTGHYTL